MSIYYAVYKGHINGIFINWDECNKSVKGYSCPIFIKCKDIKDAEYFVKYGKIRENTMDAGVFNLVEKYVLNKFNAQEKKAVLQVVQLISDNFYLLLNKKRGKFITKISQELNTKKKI